MMTQEIRLVVFDMEGTLTANPTVWELMHLKTGTWESHGLPYWEEFRAGGVGYDAFARKDVATWKGMPVSLLDEAVAEVPLMRGCAELLGFLGRRGIKTAIISNGLERLGIRLARAFQVTRVAANREVVEDGHLTGELELLIPYDEKGAALLRLAADLDVPPGQVMVVGDGVADIAMFRHAGRSVAFRPENDCVADAADHVLKAPDLRRVMPLIA